MDRIDGMDWRRIYIDAPLLISTGLVQRSTSQNVRAPRRFLFQAQPRSIICDMKTLLELEAAGYEC